MTIANFNLVKVLGCIQRLLYDTTGPFSQQNPNGWDDGGHTSGNPALSDVDTAVLTVVLPDGSIVGPIDVFSDGSSTIAFPNVSNGYVIVTGISEQNGIIEATLVYGGSDIGGLPSSDFELTTTKKFLNTCKAECCIAKLGAALETAEVKNCKPCHDAKSKAFYEASDLLLAVQQQFDCENWDMVAATIARLDAICAAHSCNC